MRISANPIILYLIACLVLIQCGSGPGSVSLPTLEQIDRYSATISWHTGAAVNGRLVYYTEGQEEKAAQEKSKTKLHRIKLGGLLPGKIYHYRINGLTGKTFYFRTAPNITASFRFAVINQTLPEIKTLEALYPDFIVILSDDSSRVHSVKEKLRTLNTRIPVIVPPFGFDWANSSFHWRVGEKKGNKENTFFFSTHGIPTGTDIKSEKGQLNILLSVSEPPFSIESKENLISVNLGSQSLIVEVQGQDIHAGPVTEAPDVEMPYVIHRAGLSYKRTCVYCRRLLEDQRYQESIRWYQRFIVENRGKPGLDDAMFQIAYIHDHYLFDYEKAFLHYKTLIDTHPETRMAQQVKFRMDYISQRSDYDYAPLKIFEKARLTGFQKGKAEKAVNSVEAILKTYPETALKEEILMWLGGVFTVKNPKKAIFYYTKTASETRADEVLWKARIAIGNIYYQNGHFRDASQVYTTLKDDFPDRESHLNPKIKRCFRNRIRQWLLYAGIIIIVLLAGWMVLLKPAGLCRPPWKRLGLVALAGTFLAAVPMTLWYDYLRTAIPFTAVFILVMVISAAFMSTVTYKLAHRPISTGLRFSIVFISGGLFLFALLYIVYYQFHLLIIFEALL
jgi:tetratricopeptide (TPR) repeat protein